jgi:flavin-dependent dehydrogenase
VIILGGGPSGAACALALQREGTALGRNVQVTVIEGKQFKGERHYNQCVGVISPPMQQLLEDELGLPFPQHLIRGAIEGYILHAATEKIRLPDRAEPSVTLRRVQFDEYMLENVQRRGIDVLPARAMDVEFHGGGVVVYTESEPVHGDVLVGAYGLDEGSASIFTRAVAYQSPLALSSVVTKYHPGPEAMADFGSYIHAFLPRSAKIEFGAFTPKGNHLTINVAGAEVDSEQMDLFLRRPYVRDLLPCLDQAGELDARDLRYFKGRFPCCRARRYYGDRYVMIGDAAGLVRAFKGKGISSAVQTGVRAARIILREGISGSAFHSRYRAANQDILRDLPYGRLMRRITILLARSGGMDAVIRVARREPGLRSALFNAVSAHAPYREVLADSLKPMTLAAILRHMIPSK